MTKNYRDFMETYGEGKRPIVHIFLNNSIEVDLPGKARHNVANIDKFDAQPFIVVHDRANRKMVLDPIIGSRINEEHLCVDAHSFLPNGNAAFTGVAGWHGEVGAAEFRPTGYTSHGWNASETIALLVGRQEITDKPEKVGDVLEDIMDDVGAEWGMDADLKARYVERLRNAR